MLLHLFPRARPPPFFPPKNRTSDPCRLLPFPAGRGGQIAHGRTHFDFPQIFPRCLSIYITLLSFLVVPKGQKSIKMWKLRSLCKDAAKNPSRWDFLISESPRSNSYEYVYTNRGHFSNLLWREGGSEAHSQPNNAMHARSSRRERERERNKVQANLVPCLSAYYSFVSLRTFKRKPTLKPASNVSK